MRDAVRAAAIVIFAALMAAAAAAQTDPAPEPPPPKPVVEVYPEAQGTAPGIPLRYALEVRIGAGWHVNANKPRDQYLVATELTLAPPEGIAVPAIIYPPADTIVLEETKETLDVYGEVFKIGLVLEPAATLAPGQYAIAGQLQYQACDAKRCLMPDAIEISIPLTVLAPGVAKTPANEGHLAGINFAASPASPEPAANTASHPAPSAPPSEEPWQSLAEGFTLSAQAGGYMSSSEFIAFLDDVESGRAAQNAGPFAGKGIWLVILLVLVGGLLLNLTPCVLPLIPVNLAIIGAGVRAGSKGRGFMLGATYGAGMAAAYGAIGLGVVMGLSETFGAINATPWFNAAIAIIFLILGLAMFDIIFIDLSRFQSRFGFILGKSGGFMAAFAMGILAALLAGACVAPVIISTLVYAQDLYAHGVTIAIVLPFLLGIGMALPWPFAGAGMAILPKPGKWMQRVKYLFGIAILALAAYYAYLTYEIIDQRYLVDKTAVQQSAQELDAHGWQQSLAAGLAQAKKENKPVFIDFWATWCKNCLAMNKTTFVDPGVVKRLDPYVKIKYQAEDPKAPETSEVLKQYKVIGLPAYVVLSPKK